MCMAGPIARGVTVGISNVSVMLQRVRVVAARARYAFSACGIMRCVQSAR